MIRVRVAVRVRVGLSLGLGLRLGGGVGGEGSVLVATPDLVHSSELQLSLATTSYPHPS